MVTLCPQYSLLGELAQTGAAVSLILKHHKAAFLLQELFSVAHLFASVLSSIISLKKIAAKTGTANCSYRKFTQRKRKLTAENLWIYAQRSWETLLIKVPHSSRKTKN